MRKLLLTAAALCAFAVPAKASFVLTPGDVGSSGLVPFAGIIEGNPQPGLSATINFTLTGVDLATNLWTFGYNVTNTSTAPITASRVSSFGFNTDPNFTLANIISGTVFTGLASGNVPQHTVVEFCATAGPNCAGGSGAGVAIGASSAGSFSLDFAGTATALTQIAFSDLYVRYQSIAGSTFGDSGVGLNGGPTPFCPPGGCPVPGPLVGAGIPSLIGALGLLGFSYWRRRRSA